MPQMVNRVINPPPQPESRTIDVDLELGGGVLGPMDSSIDVSIVIASWNTQELLHSCLGSIKYNVGSVSSQVIVIDNASHDGSAEMVERDFPDTVLLVNARNVGFAPANNQGLRHARGRYVLLLNSDTVMLPGALDEMVRYMDSHSRVGALGPRLLNADRSFQVSVYPFPHVVRDTLVTLEINRWPIVGSITRRYGRQRDEGMSAQTGEVDWVMGACLLLRRDALEDVGILDDKYFFGTEEMDLCYRLKQHEWSIVYLPAAEIIHLGGRSRARVSAAHLNWFYKGKLRFYHLYHPRWQCVALRAAIALSALGHIVALFPQHRRLPDARPLLSAYARLLVRTALPWA